MSKKASDTIKLHNVEIGFVHLADPTPKMNNDGMEYSCQVIVPKDHPQIKEVTAVLKAQVDTVFPDVHASKLKICLRDNDAEGNSKKYENLVNTFFFNAKRQVKKGQVPAVNAAAVSINPFTAEAIFSGCIVNIMVNFYTYNHPTSKGIAASVEAIQIVDNVDVVRRDGSPDVSNAFTDISADENVNNFMPTAAPATAPAAKQMDSALADAMPTTGMATEDGNDGLPWA